jgi:hypothetical protein
MDVTQVYEEIEIGSGADALDRRPQLAAALKAARKGKAPVLRRELLESELKLEALDRSVKVLEEHRVVGGTRTTTC